MGIRSQYTTAGPVMGMTEQYRRQFCRHCMLLIAWGYAEVRCSNHANSYEDTITQRIQEAISGLQAAGRVPRWAIRYVVQDQVPLGVRGKTGTARPKVDIQLLSTAIGCRPTFHCEAKRLRAEDTKAVSEYWGDLGVQEFLNEQYAAESTAGAMLGYIQSDMPNTWANKLSSKCTKEAKQYRLVKGTVWKKVKIINELPDMYETVHHRPTKGRLALYHVLLDFCGPSRN